MTIKIHSFYNPFRGSSIGILLPERITMNTTGFELKNIDLYQQPVESPDIAIVFFFVKTLLVIIDEYVCFKLLKAMKQEKSLIGDVTTIVLYIEMVFHPFWLIFTTITDLIHPLNDLLGQWFCILGWVFLNLATSAVSFHSTIVAVMRYVFIVHEEKVRLFGRDKIKKVFRWTSILLPLFGILWAGLEGPSISIFNSVNKCNGKQVQLFLAETSALYELSTRFVVSDINTSTEYFDTVLQILKDISKILRMVVLVILGFNITEGILYYNILSHLNR